MRPANSDTPATRRSLRGGALRSALRRVWSWAARAPGGLRAGAAAAARNVVTALVQIWANKGRSLLTTLGIVIAVTSIITVVAFVEGFGNHVQNMLRGYGTRYMSVHPWSPGDRYGLQEPKLTLDDMFAVRAECPLVHRISPFVFTWNAEVQHGQETAEEIPVRGVSEHYQTIRNFYADCGRFFGPVDIDQAAHVAVLGRTVLKMLHSDESLVGQHVYVDGQRFLVIGLLESKGSFLDDDQDQTIMIPYTTALRMYPQRREAMPFLVEAQTEELIPDLEQQMRRLLRTRHHLEPGQPDDFWISRQDQALSELAFIKVSATTVLSGIVGISLLVGGIGIMNVMLVSVTERTREIGLRKSVGGRRRDILLQFLTEAVVLCLVGGAVGVVLGVGLARLGGLHPKMVDVVVPWWSVALALAFSAGTGLFFGIVPACKAAILHPIDALRHE
jgi:putative ABC transport system permease protein